MEAAVVLNPYRQVSGRTKATLFYISGCFPRAISRVFLIGLVSLVTGGVGRFPSSGYARVPTNQQSNVTFVPDTLALHYVLNTSPQAFLHGTTPFWQLADTHGSREVRTRFDGIMDMRVLMHCRHWGPVNVQVAITLTTYFANTTNTACFSELYGAVRYQVLRLRIGRFWDTVGGDNDAGSLGLMVVSSNATTVPEIEFSTPGFVALILSDVDCASKHTGLRDSLKKSAMEEERHGARAPEQPENTFLAISIALPMASSKNVQWAVPGINGISPVSYTDLLA